MLVKNLTVYIEVNHFLSNGFLLIDTFFLIPSMVGGKFICILEILFIEITVEPVLFLKFKLVGNTQDQENVQSNKDNPRYPHSESNRHHSLQNRLSPHCRNSFQIHDNRQ